MEYSNIIKSHIRWTLYLQHCARFFPSWCADTRTHRWAGGRPNWVRGGYDWQSFRAGSGVLENCGGVAKGIADG